MYLPDESHALLDVGDGPDILDEDRLGPVGLLLNVHLSPDQMAILNTWGGIDSKEHLRHISFRVHGYCQDFHIYNPTFSAIS